MALAMTAQDENIITLDAQLRARGECNNGALMPRSEGQSSALFI